MTLVGSYWSGYEAVYSASSAWFGFEDHNGCSMFHPVFLPVFLHYDFFDFVQYVMSLSFHDMYGEIEILDVFDSVLLAFSLSGVCIYCHLILLFRVSHVV